MARTTNKAEELLTFSRASSGTALTKVAYGPELVTNGGFDTASDWTLTGNATISGGGVSWTTNSLVTQTSPSTVSVGKIYLVSFDITSYTSGYVYPYIGGKIQDISQRGRVVGSYEFYIFVTEVLSQQIGISSGNSPAHTVDNISVKEAFYNSPTGTLKIVPHEINKPRVEYDANGVAKGLLIEEARTNELTYSEDFTASWGVTNATITSGAAVAPDGSNTAFKLVPDVGLQSFSSIGKGVGPVTSSAYTNTIFAKAAGKTFCVLLDTQGNKSAYFNLVLGTVETVDPLVDASIQNVGNGWYRLSVTSTVTYRNFYVRATDSGSDPSVTGDGTSGIYIWGPQLEQGAFPTSYIPTSVATATRSADIASVSVDKFGYNQAQGSVVVIADTLSTGENNHQDFRLIGSAAGNSVNSGSRVGSGSAGQYMAWFQSGGSTVALLTVNDVVSDNTEYKAAYRFAQNNFALSVSGSSVVSDTVGAMPVSIDTLTLGYGYGYLNGHIKSIKYYPTRLSDEELQDLTLTKYANVYDLLKAQTAATLFDIDDTTSLRIGRDGSGIPGDGDPVGLMMDVSKTGGSTMAAYLAGATELVTNGDFSDGSTGWALGTGWSVSGGQAVGTAVNGYLNPTSISLPVGTTMRLTFDAVVTAGTISVRLGSWPSVIKVISSSGTYEIVAPITVVDDFSLQGTSFTGTIDNVSVKALPGYVATAPSDAARPTLRAFNSPIDSRDVLTTTFGWTITDGGRA